MEEKAFIILMIANESHNEEKTLFEKRGLGMFSSIMTTELRNEMNQLLAEQQNYQLEINQLKKERNFLFKLLKKQNKIQKENSRKEKEISKENSNLKFSFFHQEQISVPPIIDIKPEHSDQLHTNSKSTDDILESSDLVSDKKYFFSKSIFLDEIKNYAEIPLFERFLEIIELSNNGDSMISYFVSNVGDAFIAYELQNKKLRGDLCRIKNKQRKVFINSIESLTESKKPDIEILTNIIENYDFHDNDDDDSIWSDFSQNFDCISNSEESTDHDCMRLNKQLDIDQDILAESITDQDHKENFDDLNDFADLSKYF